MRFSIVSWNLTGFRTNFSSKFSLLSDYDIVCVQESFIDTLPSHLNFGVEHHVFYGLAIINVSVGGASGGTMVICKKSACIGFPKLISSSAWLLAVLLTLKNNEKLLVLSI